MGTTATVLNGAALWAAIVGLGLAACGTSAGGGGGSGTAPPTAAAVGAQCFSSIHQEACLDGGNHRVLCNATTGKWELIELCATGTVCVATVIDAATGRSTTACGTPRTPTDDVVTTEDAGPTDTSAPKDAGPVETPDASAPDAGGIAPIPAPDVSQPQVQAVKPIDVPCPTPDKEIKLLAGGVDCSYGVKGGGDNLVLHGPFEWKNFSESTTRKGCMMNNVLVGKMETWYGGAAKASIGHRDAQGRQHGPVLGWFANGKKNYEITAKLGKYTGWSQGWSKDGVPTWESYYDAKGKLHGKSVRWYDSGDNQAQGWYLSGKTQGPYTNWHDGGQKSYEGAYDKGLREGLHRYFTKKGALAGEAKFNKGTGTVTVTRDDGSKSWQGSWKDGKWHGQWTWWYASGEVLRQATFDMGAGTAIVLNKDLTKAFEITYVDQIADGPYRKWNASGALVEEGKNRKGSRVGTWKFYKSNGKLDYALCYFGGVATIVAECPKTMTQPWADSTDG